MGLIGFEIRSAGTGGRKDTGVENGRLETGDW